MSTRPIVCWPTCKSDTSAPNVVVFYYWWTPADDDNFPPVSNHPSRRRAGSSFYFHAANFSRRPFTQAGLEQKSAAKLGCIRGHTATARTVPSVLVSAKNQFIQELGVATAPGTRASALAPVI
jgi:hypothetical protein